MVSSTAASSADSIWILRGNRADILLCFLTEEILRVRVSFDGSFPEASYVLAAVAWEDRLDALFEGERIRVRPVTPHVEKLDTGFSFSTSRLRLVIDADPLCLHLFDCNGTLLHESLSGNAFVRDSNHRVKYSWRMTADSCYYGFGEKGGDLQKSGSFLRMRATDAMGYDPVNTDTLYKHIPFFIELKRSTKASLGVFFHNFYESVFNLGRERSNYQPPHSYWQADGGDVDFFLISGSIPEIVDRYTFLTGRPALLPKRALGYQGSSMYYAEIAEHSDHAILSFVEAAKEAGIPLDGFYLSSGYTCLDGKRCVFCWNNRRFPDPSGFFASMRNLGAPCVPNVKPGFLLTHPMYDTFREAGFFLRDSENPLLPSKGPWWGGDGSFWDFTNPGARAVWKTLLKENLLAFGADSVWNDNCEYDSLTDLDAVADFDGAGGTAGQLKPVMANLMCKCAFDAITEHSPETRPYILCRSGTAGIQRYAQTWCGDNHTDWETLRFNIPMITGMGLSGQPNEGADIGGFSGGAPDEELFIRWIQNGIFQPRFSIHSANDDNTVTEPWMFTDSLPIIRDAILLRYRFLPYLYSAEYEASCSGAPIMRPLVYEFQQDENVFEESFTFLFGRDILVANVLEPGVHTRQVYLPAGCKWFDWNDHFREYPGGQTVEIPVTMSSIPMFLREGAIVPTADNQIMSMERDHTSHLHLTVVPGRDSSFTLYDDDGVSNNYRQGLFRRTLIRMTGWNQVLLTFHSNGLYPDSVESVTVELVRRDRAPLSVTLAGTVLPRFLNRRCFTEAKAGWYYSMTNRVVIIRYPNPKKDISLCISFEKNDLIGMDQSQ